MPTNITPVDWAIVGALVVSTITVIMKWLFPAFRSLNGTSTPPPQPSEQEAEWRGEVRHILQMQTSTLATLAGSISQLTAVTMEIERRSRDAERAIRKILGQT